MTRLFCRYLRHMFGAAFLCLCMVCCTQPACAQTKELRILATSDLHGKFYPWDYYMDQENTTGSLTKLATAIAEYRTPNTLLVDAGDTIQDNAADIFLPLKDVHPMLQAMNALRYDVWVTGNHEYDFGMDILRKTIKDMNAKVLTGNVYDETGEPLADGYQIFDMDGIRVAVIGMVTPNITRWDEENLKDAKVTDPLEEIRKILSSIEGQYDVLVGVLHMDIENELSLPDSGVTDILTACPEFDICVASHGHKKIPGIMIGDTLVVENKSMAQTMAVIDLELEGEGTDWQIVKKESESIDIGGFEEDPAMTELLQPWHEMALADAHQVIGELEGGPLAPQTEKGQPPAAILEDTALLDLIHTVMRYYSDCDVSAICLTRVDANLQPGPIRKCDLSMIFKHVNSLCKLRMTGAQLKKYMEWAAKYYKTFHPGDQSVAVNSDTMRITECDTFSGINYEINLSKEPGSRIENVTWPDGTPVQDDDTIDLAVIDYRADTKLLVPGEIYDTEEELPQLVEEDIRSDLGGIRGQIAAYLKDVLQGHLTPICDHNWKLTGIGE